MDTDTLKTIPAFAELDEQQRHSIATWANEASVSEGSVLVNEGDYAYTFFAILEGSAEVIQHGNVVATLEAGSFFGETALLEGSTRNATVRALSPMRLITLTSWDLKRLEKDAPGAMARIHATSEARK